MTLIGACASACGRPAPAPPPTPPATTTPPAGGNQAAASAPAASPTGTAIDAGRAVIEQVRAAGGGPVLTAMRSFDLTGTSVMTGIKAARQLNVIALYPQFFRQEEAPAPGAKGQSLHIVMGLDATGGWLTGAVMGGDAHSSNQDVARLALERAARQAMAGFLSGINVPWLIDTGKFTATGGGTVETGPDRGALIVVLDGPTGRVGQLLVDPDTHLPRRLIEPAQRGAAGQVAVADTIFTYSDFAPQGALRLPHTIVRENGRNKTVWTILRYAINPPLRARNFARSGR